MRLFVFSCLVACAGKPVSSSCLAEVNPPSPVVRFGDPVSANCTALSDQVHGMGWESTVDGVPLTLGVTSLTLNIPAVTNWDLRAFCFVNFNNGSQCKSILHVTIYKMPDIVTLSELSNPLIEGQKYRLLCHVGTVAPARNFSVHWHKGNEIIFTETFQDAAVQPVLITSFFDLMAHRKDNGTQIWCEAKLNLWPAPDPSSVKSQSQDINVLYPPTFFSPADERIEFTEHSKIILNCLASGNPMPVYSWHFAHPIQLKAKNQTTDQPILTPYIQLPGIYNCTVSNSQGSRTKHFTVVEAVSKRDHTILAAVVGVFASLGVLLFLGGLYFVTPDGTFAFNKGSYQRGQPASSGPV